MRRCLSCGGDLGRVRRTFWEKLRYQAVHQCKQCKVRTQEDQWYLFLFGGVSRCPKCGTHRVHRLRGIDPIDRMYRNPFSYLQKYMGGSLHWCSFCRLQFYDLREKAPSAETAAASTNTARSGK